MSGAMGSLFARAALFRDVLRIRLHQARLLPVGPDDLVLDIGSGGSPNLRANVLCDRFVADDTDRQGTRIAHPAGRPFVIGDAHCLPFADRAFDYVVCSHLLEHVRDPLAVVAELQRVAKAGYIETPSRVAEKMHSLPIHRWLVGVEDDRLVFEAKTEALLDRELREWFDAQLGSNADFRPLWMKQWQAGLLTQFWWRDGIEAEVRGEPFPQTAHEPATSTDGDLPGQASGMMARVDALYGGMLRRRSRRRARDLLPLLACPLCRSGLARSGSWLGCQACGRSYPLRGETPVLVPEAAE